MQRELVRVGWHAEFLMGVRPDSADGFPSIGARGSFLSHLQVLKAAQHSVADHVVILEDDLNFSDGFSSAWEKSISFLKPKEWSIFLAGHSLRGPREYSVPPSTGFIGAHFIVIKIEAVPKIIDGLEKILFRPPGHPEGGPMFIDGAYSTLRMQDHSLITYASFPALGYQRASRSDIAQRRWFDNFAMLRRLIELARRIKNLKR